MQLKTWLKDLRRLGRVDISWFLIWVMIYLGFLTLDIFYPEFWVASSILKYTGIFLCIIYAHHKYGRDYMLQLALLFTFLADTILVWTPHVIPGVYVFSVAQFLHLMRLTKLPRRALSIYAAMISLFFAITITLGLTPIYAIATVYGLELICNLVMAIKNYRANRKDFRARCAFYGFSAFICCDICVAIRFLAITGTIPGTLTPIIALLVWVFYYPSQVLISNSSNYDPVKRQKFAKNKSIG